MARGITATLDKAVEGLLYQSEQDAPWEPLSWRHKGELTADKVRELGKHKAGSPVREVNFDKFFAALTTEEDWHEDEEKATVEKYRKLVDVLRQQFSELKVFKAGETEVTVYVVGKTTAGTWAGVKTAAVET